MHVILHDPEIHGQKRQDVKDNIGSLWEFFAILSHCDKKQKEGVSWCVIKPLTKLGVATLEGLALTLVHVSGDTTRLMLYIMVNF